MPYTPINWQDGEAGGTPLSAANLNHMETQYEQAVADAVAVANAYTDDAIAPLAPLIPQVGVILNSQIVDHNLDTGTTDFFVRFANGLQWCFGTAQFPFPWHAERDQTMLITWAMPFTAVLSANFSAVSSDPVNVAVINPTDPTALTTTGATVHAVEFTHTAFSATSATMIAHYSVIGTWA